MNCITKYIQYFAFYLQHNGALTVLGEADGGVCGMGFGIGFSKSGAGLG